MDLELEVGLDGHWRYVCFSFFYIFLPRFTARC